MHDRKQKTHYFNVASGLTRMNPLSRTMTIPTIREYMKSEMLSRQGCHRGRLFNLQRSQNDGLTLITYPPA